MGFSHKNSFFQAVERGNVDCPICLTPLEKDGLVQEACTETKIKTGTSSQAKSKKRTLNKGTGDKKTEETVKLPIKHIPKRERTLLSCSHVFHKTCLDTFEELAEGDRRFMCPVCRTAYQKRTL